MKFSPIILFFVAMLGCGSESPSSKLDTSQKSQEEALDAITNFGAFVILDESDEISLIDLGGTKITDADLVNLKGMTSLKSLTLKGTKISDTGLEHLKGLTRLKILNLDNTNVSDTGLEHLKGLSSLKWLYLDNTKVTDKGVNKLHKALSNCDIKR